MPVNGIMTNEIIEIRAYEWNDVFTDLSLSNPTFNSLNQVSQATHFYADESQSGVNFYLPFESPVPMIDNQKYLFCIYNASNELRLGYDVSMDYTATVDNYLQPISPVKILPNSQAAQWYWAGFGLDATPSISVTMDYLTGEAGITHENQFLAYPNPAASLLTVPVRNKFKGDVNIDVFDLSGKLVLSDSKTIGEESLKVNVASISNGTYLFNLTFSDGSKDSFKVSVNR